jgi:superfamily II DNA or RNA helicase
MTKLITVFTSSSNWDDIYNNLLQYNTPQKNSAGKLFEEFCKYYYLTEPTVKHEYKHVWLFSEIPHTVKEKLNLGKIDHGIDLVLEGHDGTFSVIQCKFRNNQNANISWTKDSLANLFAEGDQADYFIVFTNASGLDKHSLSKKANKLKLITLGDLINISSSTINEIKSCILGITNKKISTKHPREYQQIAIQKVLDGFKQRNRGQLILPCGAGKTLVSLWIKEALNIKHTLVLVPSLALLRQIKNEWSINTERYIPYICVCSEKDIDKGKDRAIVHTYEIGGRVSTNPNEIRSFLNKNNETIVYCTYQSLEAICNAVNESGFKFDLAICDEAHKTSGSKLSKFGLIHSDSNLPVKKRLYMTATPRVLSDSMRNELSNEVINYIYDMGNIDIFGPEFYRMNFKEAIDKKILVDYKVFAIGICNEELEEAIKQRKYISDHETIDEVANNYALEKFMKNYNATHAITFHSSVKKAESFKIRHQQFNREINIFHVHGNQTTNERAKILEDFKNREKSIITNARCLTEGVDVPAVDIIYFCDSKNSKIDIIQAVGRALRRADYKGKELGYILVPIFHRESEQLEKMIETGSFKNLVKIIRALSSYDERMTDEVNSIKLGKLLKQESDKRINFETPLHLITLDGFQEELKNSLFDQVISKIQVPFRAFDEARNFAHTLKINSSKEWIEYAKSNNRPVDIPFNPYLIYRDSGWISWGDWLGTGNISYNKNFLPFNEARKYTRALHLKSQKEWLAYVKSGNKPDNIPSFPNEVYKNKGWKSIGDWLGTQTIATFNLVFRNFDEAKNFIHTLKIKNQIEWRQYTKTKERPKDIPTAPDRVYKNKGWISWPDWLGRKSIHQRNIVYRSFEEAKNYVRTLQLNNRTEWSKYCKSGEKPEDIPSHPNHHYKYLGWLSWANWLGKRNIVSHGFVFQSFDDARKFVHTLNLKNKDEWKKFYRSGNKPTDIPSNPQIKYKDQGWISWGDWLGSGTIAPKNRIFRSFEDARKFVRTLGLKGEHEWRQFSKTSGKPEDIPAVPSITYKNKGWISWSDWLGTNPQIFTKAREYIPESFPNLSTTFPILAL